ncbi:MAG TPA: hypothetical protein VNU70_07495, partial [Puia sp.]|nr:hypothetical protein [Puia sp.]
MPRIVFSLLICLTLTGRMLAQPRPPETAPAARQTERPNEKPVAGSRVLNLDSSVTTQSDVTIKGQHVPYTAT